MAHTPETETLSARRWARARELLVQAGILAAVLWTVAAIEASGPANRGRFSGLPIGTDFVAFYTYAHVGWTRNADGLQSDRAFFAEQTRLVPESVATLHVPMYPPQVALLLAPLARLSYSNALSVWATLSVLVYALVVWAMARTCQRLRRWPAQVAMVALANPALWMLVLHGQLSMLALGGLSMCWLAMQAGRPLLAGISLGILAYKPPLFVPAVALCVLAGERRIAAGAALGAAAQYAVSLPWVGPPGIQEYVIRLWDLARTPDRVAGNPPLMHSLRTFWSGLLPGWLAIGAYGISSGAVLANASRLWRQAPPLMRAAIMGLVIVLTSPHLYAYDLILLTPLLLASADLVLAGRGSRRLSGWSHAAYFAPLWGIPAAALAFQASTIAFVAWLVEIGRSQGAMAGRDGRQPGASG